MGQSAGKHARCAARHNDVEALRKVASTSPQALLKQSLWKHRTALHAAASAGSLAALAAVLEIAAHYTAGTSQHGSLTAYLNCPDHGGNTALALACKHGHVDCVSALLEAGANPLPANCQGITPLHLAAVSGNAACIRLLLTTLVRLADGSRTRAADAPVNDIIDTERFIDTRTHAGLCALHLAVLSGSHQAVTELVTHGCQLDMPLLSVGLRAPVMMPPCLSAGSTALHMAAATGRALLCTALLHAQQQRHPGLELRRMRNARGMTPLTIALLCGHRHLASLLAAGAPLPAPLPAPRTGQLPPLLRQQLQALVHRAALLAQLRQLGLGTAAAAVGPPLAGLVPGAVGRLEALLHSENATASQVLAGLDELLDDAAAAGGGGGSSSSEGSPPGSTRAGAGASAADRQRSRRRQRRRQQEAEQVAHHLAAAQSGVDWTMLERRHSLWYAEHVDRSLYRRLHRRQERHRPVQAHLAPSAAAPMPGLAAGEALAASAASTSAATAAAGGGAATLPAAGTEQHALLLAGALVQREQQQGDAGQETGGAASSSGGSSSGSPGDAGQQQQEQQEGAAAAAAEPQPGSHAASQADGSLCPICLDLPAGVAMAPCGHRACLACCGRLASYCLGSGSRLPQQGPLCPLCRGPIEGFAKTL